MQITFDVKKALFIKNLKMKVLLFMPDISMSSGGTTTWLRTLEVELGKKVELHIATRDSDNSIDLQESTVHFLHASPWKGLKNEWKKLLEQIRPDIVHINCCWLPIDAYTLRWSQKLGYKTVLTPHGMLEPWIMQRNYWTKKLPATILYQRKAVKQANIVHATAVSEKQNLLKLGWNYNIQVVGNGIDVDHIPLKKDWSLKKNILFLSRIHPKKGIEILLDAIVRLKTELEGYTVTIAGEGETDYVDQIKDRSKAQGIDHLINFVGPIYGDAKYVLFRNADIFILPTYSENFGLVVAEALSSGTPVITTTGTPWQDLKTANCGDWVDPNPKAVAEALQKMISYSPIDLEILGKNGRRLVEEQYSNQKMAAGILEMYNNVISV